MNIIKYLISNMKTPPKIVKKIKKDDGEYLVILTDKISLKEIKKIEKFCVKENIIIKNIEGGIRIEIKTGEKNEHVT